MTCQRQESLFDLPTDRRQYNRTTGELVIASPLFQTGERIAPGLDIFEQVQSAVAAALEEDTWVAMVADFGTADDDIEEPIR